MTQKRLMQFLDFHTTYVPQQLSLLTVSHDDYLVVEVEHDKGLLVLLRPSRLKGGRAGLAISGTEAGGRRTGRPVCVTFQKYIALSVGPFCSFISVGPVSASQRAPLSPCPPGLQHCCLHVSPSSPGTGSGTLTSIESSVTSSSVVSLALEFLQDPYLETLHPLGIFFCHIHISFMIFLISSVAKPLKSGIASGQFSPPGACHLGLVAFMASLITRMASSVVSFFQASMTFSRSGFPSMPLTSVVSPSVDSPFHGDRA